MIAILLTLALFFIIFLFNYLYDYFLCKKFKVGYIIDLFMIEHIALETYSKIGRYKIIAKKNNYISVCDSKKRIFDFDIYKLVSSTDMIKIRDEKGYLFDIVYKKERF